MKITLVNFKGIRSRTEVFNQDTPTTITGANGSGKTTIVDGFLWLLFDKDSAGRSDFEVKPLDQNNQVIPRIDHEVSAVVYADGIRIDLRKCLQENWVKPRGRLEEVLQGNVTTYYWNDVPLKKSEYQAKVATIVNEDLFRLITSPAYFNHLHWQQRRATLIAMAGAISNSLVLDAIRNKDNGHRVDELLDVLTTGKSIDELKKEIGAKKSKIKDELDTLPARIDEVERNKPEHVDIAAASIKIKELDAEIKAIEQALMDGNASTIKRREQLNELNLQLDRLEMRKQPLERSIMDAYKAQDEKNLSEVRNLKGKMTNAKSELDLIINDLDVSEIRIKRLENSLAISRQNYADENERQFDIEMANLTRECYACKQPLPQDNIERQIEEMAASFIVEKKRKIDIIREQGKHDRAQLDAIVNQMTDLKARRAYINELMGEFTKELEILSNANANTVRIPLEEMLSGNDELQGAHSEIKTITDKLAAVHAEKEDDSVSQLKEKRDTLDKERTCMRNLLNNQEQIIKADERIDQLETQMREQNQALADLEANEYIIQCFVKAKMDMVQDRVNAMFPTVRFKMFEEQLNGGEKETCDCLIGGVPYSDANYAARINSGLEIINVLCDHYNTFAPIFIDNAESVEKFTLTKSQTIYLRVPGVER